MVGLVEKSEAAFREYRVELSRDYVQDKVRAGAWSAQEAEDGAVRELEELLPEGDGDDGAFPLRGQGRVHPGHRRQLMAGGSRLLRWPVRLCLRYLIHEEFRRRGCGAITFGLLEEKARELGAGRVGLHVFGHNDAARALYEKMG